MKQKKNNEVKNKKFCCVSKNTLKPKYIHINKIHNSETDLVICIGRIGSEVADMAQLMNERREGGITIPLFFTCNFNLNSDDFAYRHHLGKEKEGEGDGGRTK